MQMKIDALKLFFMFTYITVSSLNISLIAQDQIHLKNPSFEDVPRQGAPGQSMIKDWHDCGWKQFPSESPPDIHPVPGNAWGVSKLPKDGRTFLGLVVRDNDTYESLSQKLESPLSKEKCYTLSVYLARSEFYKSRTMKSQEIENFISPVVLQIWGGDNLCDKKQLLAQSAPVENAVWMINEFILSPNSDYSFVTIEAFYVTGNLEAYNGHILVDGFSPILQLDCK